MLGLCALLGALGCRAPGEPRPASTAPLARAPAAPAPAASQLPAFRALQAALADGEDELAGQLVARLRAFELGPAERERLASAERVLAGRALVRSLELVLVSEPVADAPAGSYRLFLDARSNASAPLRLVLPPADLKRLRCSMDARGVEGLEYESRASSALSGVELGPGAERRLELLTYELPLGRALAVRERWRLEPRSGEIESGGARYPAARVRVEGCERERLSPLVAPDPVSSAELCTRLAGAEPAGPRELLELALRVPRSERDATLDALTPVVAHLARADAARVAAAEPALRWLSENRDIGPDAPRWARYLEARASSGEEADAQGADLDLPAPPRSSR